MLLIAAEALNTAIERIVDHLTQDWAQFAKEAKDLGSLAVMCVLICHVMLLVHVVVW
jgi:diacylglycerol kinase (ATP)